MLQIIGWMGSLYLLVKGLELLSSPKVLCMIGGVLAVAGAIAFPFLLQNQVNATNGTMASIGNIAPLGGNISSNTSKQQAMKDAVAAASEAAAAASEADAALASQRR